jgi:hypothetical protein
MCIIIDANVVHEFLPVSEDIPLSEDAEVVFSWLTRRGGVMAVGGRLKREILAVAKFRTLYQRLVLAGQLYQYDDNEVDSAEGVARRNLALVSDDPHIIALAQISECRLLFSRDRNLHRDFSNPNVLTPRGRVYQRRAHQHLLRNAAKCRLP